MTGEVLYELVRSNLTNLLLYTVVFNTFTLHGFSSSSLLFPSTFHNSIIDRQVVQNNLIILVLLICGKE